MDKIKIKTDFLQKLQHFAQTLKHYVSTPDNQWTIKGFIDVFENIYTISSDTKIISKILEIHLFSKFLEFAKEHHFDLVLAEKKIGILISLLFLKLTPISNLLLI